MRRRRIAGSLIGGIRETQEMLDFCAEYGVAADVEVIPIQQINEAYERMVRRCTLPFRDRHGQPQAASGDARLDEECYGFYANSQTTQQ